MKQLRLNHQECVFMEPVLEFFTEHKLLGGLLLFLISKDKGRYYNKRKEFKDVIQDRYMISLIKDKLVYQFPIAEY